MPKESSHVLLYKIICSLSISTFDQIHISLIVLSGPLTSRYIIDLEMTFTFDPKPSCNPCLWPMTLTFNLLRALAVSYTHAKDEGQRSVDSSNRMETKGQMDRADCITFLTNIIGADNMVRIFECLQCLSLFQHVDYCSPMYNADICFLSKWWIQGHWT